MMMMIMMEKLLERTYLPCAYICISWWKSSLIPRSGSNALCMRSAGNQDKHNAMIHWNPSVTIIDIEGPVEGRQRPGMSRRHRQFEKVDNQGSIEIFEGTCLCRAVIREESSVSQAAEEHSVLVI